MSHSEKYNTLAIWLIVLAAILYVIGLGAFIVKSEIAVWANIVATVLIILSPLASFRRDALIKEEDDIMNKLKGIKTR